MNSSSKWVQSIIFFNHPLELTDLISNMSFICSLMISIEFQISSLRFRKDIYSLYSNICRWIHILIRMSLFILHFLDSSGLICTMKIPEIVELKQKRWVSRKCSTKNQLIRIVTLRFCFRIRFPTRTNPIRVQLLTSYFIIWIYTFTIFLLPFPKWDRLYTKGIKNIIISSKFQIDKKLKTCNSKFETWTQKINIFELIRYRYKRININWLFSIKNMPLLLK